MVIDFHVHCFPDALAPKATASLSRFAGGLPFHTDGTVGDVLASMRRGGIDASVIQHIATRPSHTPAVNRWAAEIDSTDIISFGSIHPDYPDWREEIAFLRDAKLKGVKFHPDYQDFYVDEKRLYPLYEALAQEGFIMLFHAGRDLGYEPPYKCMPDMLRKVLDDFPGAKIVAAHMGAYEYWDAVEEYLAGQDIYLDTSYCLMGMDDAAMERLIRLHGADKVLFGSDSPWADQQAEAQKIRALHLTKEEMDQVLGGNAQKLLGL
jgi:predicted TIM-barrel fold metal-dependent hydrolase